ncbi:alpha/beta hydrolase family protein [Tsuneonella sp. HG222]
MRLVAVFRGIMAGLALSLAPAPLAAQESLPAEIATSVFAGRSPFGESPQLAPDGRRIAYSFTVEGQDRVGVIDIDNGAIEDLVPIAGMDLRWVRWAGNDRLLMSVMVPVKTSWAEGRIVRLLVRDLAKKQLFLVGPKAQGVDGDDVIHVDPAGRFILLSVSPDLYSEPEVWRMSLETSGDKGTKIESKRGIWSWFADDAGVVRMGLGYENRNVKVWYRKSAQDKLEVIARVGRGDEDTRWDLSRLIGETDEGYVLKPGDDGRIALRRFNYATREPGEVVYAMPGWDILDFQLDDSGKPLAVRYADDRDRIVWLDPEIARLQADLSKALGGEQARILQMARDRSRMLVEHSSASDPGTWYVYTPATKRLAEFSRMRPDLDPKLLGPARAVDYSARDGTKIRAYLTLPPGRPAKGLPLIVMPHGGPFNVRDQLSYVDEVQLLANRGYAVLQPNFRGSAGFGEEFERLGDGEIGRKMQDDLDDAMDWAVAQGIADPQRACLVGASYGGYAAVWGALRNPERWRCAASFAGVMDWEKQLSYQVDFLDRDFRSKWKSRVRGEDAKFDLAGVSPARNARRLTRPVLIVQGREDRIVPFGQYLVFRDAMQEAGNANAQYLILDKSGHNFASPEDEKAWYDALLKFLARHNPAG